ncbi:TrmH family RNA methyltransferase [Adlercreutzia agrestimuris]|uniref:TrmH family RNA methyltransferase n=1 Tax=Adlercreutzia agrestimuris TaxID=2941324 RepID=UPI0020403FB9|nr:RNA methyltransferase [Adlercreutzia agrestimuris]
MLTYLDALDDARLDVYARLTDVALRSKLEPEQGICIVESAKVIDRALDAGLQPCSLLLEAHRVETHKELIQRFETLWPDTPIYVAPRDELAKLTGFNLTRGALAAFFRPQPESAAVVLARATRVAILEDITNHTNVGAIFRSAAALGMDAVLITPGCYDPLYRRALRVSMGAVFQIPWAYIGTDVEGPGKHGNVIRAGGWSETGIPLLHEHGFKVAALALSDNSIALNNPILQTTDKLALVLGTEGEGLSDHTIMRCDYTVKIPMSHGVDSLNVAAASAVAFWQVRALQP